GVRLKARANTVETVAMVWCATAFAVLLALSVLQYRTTAQLVAFSGGVAHTEEVLAEIQALLARTTQAESSVRGYAVTHDEKFLATYPSALDEITKHVRVLRQLAADDLRQQRRLDELESLLTRRLKHLQRVIDAGRAAGKVAVSRIIATGAGVELMNQIRAIVEEIGGE